MTIDDKKLRTIAALLAKANDKAATEAEAATYMAKATELMVKHGIDEAQLTAASSGSRTENIITFKLVFEGVYAPEQLHMSHLIALALGLQTYQVRSGERTRSGRQLYLVGFENDVQLTRLIIGSLDIQCATALSRFLDEIKKDVYRWLNMTAGDKYKARRAFIMGFGKKVAERIKATRQQVVTEAGSGAEVALRDRADAVRLWLEEAVPDLKQVSGVRKYRVNAQAAGAAAGSQADIGGTKVGVHTGHKAIGN